jgi:uncharacterized repeat protein (TIGR01451 family)
MNRTVAISGMALFTAGLLGWVALAGAPPIDTLPSAGERAAQIGSSDLGGGIAASGEIPIRPRPANPAGSLPGSTPAPTALSGDPYPIMPAMPTPPSGSPPVKAPAIEPLSPLPQQPSPTAPMPQIPAGPAGYPNLPNQSAPPSGSLLPMDSQATAPGGYGTTPGTAPQPLNGLPSGTTLPPLGGAAEPSGLPAETNEERTPHSPLVTDDLNNRQEPAVSLQWVGPTAAKVNQPNAYNLVIRNICTIPVQQVMVRVRIPDNLSCGDAEPRAVAEGNVMVWELGALQPKEEKVLRMKLLAERKGDAAPQAWVTFTGSSILHIKVREPKLALKVQGSPKLLLGETAAFQLDVTNAGDGTADQVKIHANLSEGLECPRGNKIDFDVGSLAAGETRTVTVMCITKRGGAQKCEAVAEAEGGLRAQEAAQVNVTTPRLELQLAGPGLRYLGRKALYSFKVSNPGDAPASNVTMSDVVPEGFKVLAASDGGRHDFSAHTVSWFIGDIKPGETREVKLEVQAANPGEFKHKVCAVGAHNLNAESELATRVEGLSALMLEMVDVEDPIEVNSDTSYEVRISNTGSKVETKIKLVATIPDKMEFKSATGPVPFHEEGKQIVFEPLEKLAPRADAVFRINVKATDQGIVRFKIQMTSTNLTEPVIKMEATRIYSDAPETKSSH